MCEKKNLTLLLFVPVLSSLSFICHILSQHGDNLTDRKKSFFIKVTAALNER